MSTPNDIARLRAQLKRLKDDTLTSNTSLSNINATIEEKIAAVNQSVGAVAASILSVSSSLSVSLETASVALQEALQANIGAVLGDINELSGNLKGTIEERADALQEGLTTIIDVLLPDISSSTAERADALSASLSTLIEVTLPEGFEDVETKRQNLSSSLSDLINQNETTFTNRLDSLDGDVDGIIENIEVITGSWDDYTAAVDSINEYTGSVKVNLGELNVFKNTTNTEVTDVKRRVKGLAENENDEEETKTSISALVSSVIENYKNLNFSLPSKGLWYPTPENYWAYTVAYPTGRNPFKIKSYSYMGTKTGNKYWNLEDVITYTKRLYGINESVLNYDSNNTMLNNGAVTQNSQLYLKADEIKIEKGRTNLTSPTLTIIGETSDTDGTGNDQGQLFIRDEDSSNYGLSLGYKYNGTNDYARIQAYNSSPLGLQLGGGQVGIGGLKNGYGILYIKDTWAANINLDAKEGHIISRQHFVLGNQVYLDTKAYRGRDDRNDWYAFSIKQQLKVDDEEAYMASVTYNPFLNNAQHGYGIALETDNKPRVLVKGNGAVWVQGGTAAEAGINIWNGDVALNLGHYSNNENSGRIQVKSGGSAGSIGTSNYRLRLNPDGGDVYVFTTQLSDERIKYDIQESILGLDFINKIKPVSYKYKVRDTTYTTGSNGEEIKIEKAGVRPHYGFIAQQVKEVLGENDFAGYVYEPSIDEHALRYDEFISPMVKAIQELSQKNDYLEKKLEEKDKQLQDILSRLSALESK